MTRRVTWTTHCDAPSCQATTTADELPADWTWIWSATHLKDTAPIRASRRSNTLTFSERSAGAFGVHLCADHRGVFDAHQPQSSSWPGTRGGPSTVMVSCSCGASLGSHSNVTFLVAAGKPSSAPERAWWSHLPDDLKQYARGVA